MAIERLKTGIHGLDEMLRGGIPKNRHVIIAGGPGTGKTTFGMQYLYTGALQGEKGAYISLEEPTKRVVENVKAAFSKWRLDEVIEKRLIELVKIEKHTFYNFVDLIQAFVTQHGVKRVVVDPSTILELYFEKPAEYRKAMFDLLDFLGGLDCTALLTAELPVQQREDITFGLELFVADGIIILYNLPREERRIQAVEILKMRGTEHARNIAPIKFTPDGIVVYPEEKIY